MYTDTYALQKASFYPNRCGVVTVRVRGQKINTTNDLGTANDEVRHFIDSAFLRMLPRLEGEEKSNDLMDSIVVASPSCHTVWGTKSEEEERVLGMLSKKLEVEVVAGAGHKAFIIHLDRVLVVDSLPVPLHISAKALLKNAEAGCDKTQRGLIYKAFGTFGAVFRKEDFPPAYRRHPYWTREGIHCVGSLAFTSDPGAARNRSTAFGANALTTRYCGGCGKKETAKARLKKCSRCMAEAYCGQECQRAAWSSHKKKCSKVKKGKRAARKQRILA